MIKGIIVSPQGQLLARIEATPDNLLEAMKSAYGSIQITR